MDVFFPLEEDDMLCKQNIPKSQNAWKNNGFDCFALSCLFKQGRFNVHFHQKYNFLRNSVYCPPYCLIVALAVEERARQLQMRVPSYRPGSSTSFGHDPEAELKNRRDVSLKLAFRSPTHLSGSAGWWLNNSSQNLIIRPHSFL